MKHVSSFNGAVTSLLTRMGLDSTKVLAACNAWRGTIRATDSESKSTITLTGKVNKDGEDKRALTVTDRTKETAKKVGVAAPGLLLAISDECQKLTEKHGVTLQLERFPADIQEWLNRDSFRPDAKPEQASEKKPVTAAKA